MRFSRSILALTMTLAPAAAFAHPGMVPHVHGFAAGLAHPLTGLDHLLAMVAVGLWASQKGGRAFWLWPASFVAAMGTGGALGMAGIAFPGIEPAIAASLLVLGLMIATLTRLPLAAGAALIAAFGLFHGNAHGLEAPASAASALYALGFVVSTATLHVLGLGLGLMARDRQVLVRAAACLVALTGAALFFA